MNAPQNPRAWARGYFERQPGPVPKTQTAMYRLSDLVNQGFIHAGSGRGLLMKTGLVDFTWQVTWAEDYETPDAFLADRIGQAQGYVIFVHGWTGNHRIWEELPGLVVRGNRHLIALSVDHNGFGQSRFVDETPALDACNPPAAMRVIEQWVNLLKIRRQAGERDPRVINFVGHSMGGAMLFYLNPADWRFGEATRCALAPALLLQDNLHRAFYTTLGLGIGIVNRIKAFSVIERAVKPGMVDVLCNGASEFVKQAHHQQYDETPRGITAATFTAMGLLNDHEIAREWEAFRVMLGHKDRLVGLTQMIDLLSGLGFPSANLRVVPGSHYMFSIGPDGPDGADATYQHAQNRDLVVADILAMHNKAYQQQLTGHTVG